MFGKQGSSQLGVKSIYRIKRDPTKQGTRRKWKRDEVVQHPRSTTYFLRDSLSSPCFPFPNAMTILVISIRTFSGSGELISSEWVVVVNDWWFGCEWFKKKKSFAGMSQSQSLQRTSRTL